MPGGVRFIPEHGRHHDAATGHAGTGGVHHPGRRLRLAAQNYATVGLFNFAVARADLPEDLVFAVVEAVFRTAASSKRPARRRRDHTANFSRNSFLPFHRGACATSGRA